MPLLCDCFSKQIVDSIITRLPIAVLIIKITSPCTSSEVKIRIMTIWISLARRATFLLCFVQGISPRNSFLFSATPKCWGQHWWTWWLCTTPSTQFVSNPVS